MAVAQAWLGGIGKYPPHPSRLGNTPFVRRLHLRTSGGYCQPLRIRRVFSNTSSPCLCHCPNVWDLYIAIFLTIFKSHTLEEWHRHGEEVLENILWILRGWGNISDVRRRSRRTRRYCLNLEGWGGYFSNTSEPCLCHFHCNLRKINYPLFRNGGYRAIYPLLPRGGIDQYTPSRQ